MPNLVNNLIATEYDGLLAKAEGVIVMSLGRVTVKELEPLRNKLAKDGVRVRMVRSSLLRRALAAKGYEASAELLAGNTGIAYGSLEGTIAAAKILTADDVKKPGKIQLRGAIFDGVLIGAKDAVALAGLPDKKTLRGQLVGCLVGPMRGLVTTLNGLPSGTVRVLQAKIDKAGGTGEAPEVAEAS
ncbi:MAG: 50S ribosomal protein L10 [Planctomycetota bacterium]|nr:50S ribosomal protein L10 [Planctomycetota bacterium]